MIEKLTFLQQTWLKRKTLFQVTVALPCHCNITVKCKFYWIGSCLKRKKPFSYLLKSSSQRIQFRELFLRSNLTSSRFKWTKHFFSWNESIFSPSSSSFFLRENRKKLEKSCRKKFDSFTWVIFFFFSYFFFLNTRHTSFFDEITLLFLICVFVIKNTMMIFLFFCT